MLTFIVGQRIPDARSSTICCNWEETWTWVCLSLLYSSPVEYKHTPSLIFFKSSQATFPREHLVCYQKAAPSLLPASGSLRVVSVMLPRCYQEQDWLAVLQVCVVRGANGGWQAFSPATAVVQGCVSRWGWGEVIVRTLQVLILHLKHRKGQNLEYRGRTHRVLFCKLGCSHLTVYWCLTSLCFMNFQSSCWLCKSPQSPSTPAYVPKSATVTMETEG